MTRKRLPPDDPQEWLNRARSNLLRAKSPVTGAYLEDFCFDAQQAAETCWRFPESPSKTGVLNVAQVMWRQSDEDKN